ncbi:hypothetical protein GCM10022200_24590 [Microbacterium awajiense]|uniref:Uncharacterized protein n=1 Tax=Microbacterium awajiense TaxID=415214 RepID=A0ABP7ATF4_9MICO
MAASTRATVAGATLSGRLSTFETVPTDTEAAMATSRTLTLMLGSRSLSRPLKRYPFAAMRGPTHADVEPRTLGVDY